MAAIQRCFEYVFDGAKKESNIPQLDVKLLNGAAVDVLGLEVRRSGC